MATVWKSWDRDLGRWVAVKVLQIPTRQPPAALPAEAQSAPAFTTRTS